MAEKLSGKLRDSVKENSLHPEIEEKSFHEETDTPLTSISCSLSISEDYPLLMSFSESGARESFSHRVFRQNILSVLYLLNG